MAHNILVGTFGSEDELLKAVRGAREAGLLIHDVFTPFPVHGMDQAMGLRDTRLPLVCFFFGSLGLLVTLAFQFWVSVFDWPMNIGGKSFNASPALIPVAFEMTVLFAGLGAVAAFLARRGLWPGRRPFLAELGASDDRFLLALTGGAKDDDAIRSFLKSQNPVDISETGGAR